VAVLGTLLLVGSWWMLSAHKWFTGPIVQGTEEELARIEAQYGEDTRADPAPAS
jgi:protein-S-isoprenylcysteine O-methyltransferase Ste14